MPRHKSVPPVILSPALVGQVGNPPRGTLLLALFLILTALTAGETDTRLIDAVKSGNREAVRALLKNRALLNTPEPDGTTALQWAVRADDLPIVESLLSAGANAKAPNRYGVTPLELAANNGNPAITAALLKAGADPTAIKSGGQTILMAAARTGNPEVVRILLERGGEDVNAKEASYGETALMWAASENHAAAAKLLIEHGAEVNARSTRLTYPKDRFGLEGVITVLPHGNWTPLMYAARQGSLGAARVLAEKGADLNLTDPDGTTALVLAIINSHYDTAALLLTRGADPNLADSTGMSPLYATVDMNTLGEVYGRPARQQVSGDTTALDLMKLLLEHGAKPNVQLKTPTLYRAHTPGEPTLGEGATPLMRAAKNGDAAAIRLLLEHGADPAIAQRNHTTALMLAAGFGRGLGVFAKDYATEAQMIEGLNVLLDRHVDVNAVNDSGQTALHFAALSSDATVKLLAEHGAQLDIKDKQGRTPLDFALGAGGRGRAGALPVPRESTAALLRQLNTPHVIGILNYVHAVNDVDKTVAFYRDVIGLEVGRPPSDFPNPGVPSLLNAPGVHLRMGTMKLPGAKYVMELTQFSGVERKPGQPLHTDPGAALLQLSVRDIDTLFAAIRKSGVPVITRSGAPVKVGPNGNWRALMVRDPDGYIVEIIQLPAPSDAPAGNVFAVGMGLTVKDMVETQKFYRDMLGFDLTGKPEFSSTSAILDLVGAPAGAENREWITVVPGTDARVFFYEYRGLPRTPFHLRVQDPGAPALVMRVNDLDAMLKRLKAIGTEVVSAHGEPVQFSPTVRNIFVVDPNGVNLELYESK